MVRSIVLKYVPFWAWSKFPQVSKRRIWEETKIETIRKELSEKGENIKGLLDEVRSHNIQTVTTLSIFACIVFAFTGGFSIAGNSLTAIVNIKQSNAPFFLACMLLLMLVLYDVIHMLLYFTHRLTLGDAKGKHYLFWAINIIGLLGAIGLLIWYFSGHFWNIVMGRWKVDDYHGLYSHFNGNPVFRWTVGMTA